MFQITPNFNEEARHLHPSLAHAQNFAFRLEIRSKCARNSLKRFPSAFRLRLWQNSKEKYKKWKSKATPRLRVLPSSRLLHAVAWVPFDREFNTNLKRSKLSEKHHNSKDSTCLALVKPFPSQNAFFLRLLEKMRRINWSLYYTTTTFEMPNFPEHWLLCKLCLTIAFSRCACDWSTMLVKLDHVTKQSNQNRNTCFSENISSHQSYFAIIYLDWNVKSPKSQLNFFS